MQGFLAAHLPGGRRPPLGVGQIRRDYRVPGRPQEIPSEKYTNRARATCANLLARERGVPVGLGRAKRYHRAMCLYLGSCTVMSCRIKKVFLYLA